MHVRPTEDDEDGDGGDFVSSFQPRARIASGCHVPSFEANLPAREIRVLLDAVRCKYRARYTVYKQHRYRHKGLKVVASGPSGFATEM